MSPAEPFSLRQTNVNRPQLLHADSQRSVTATEDYHSIESESTESDERAQLPIHQFETPPSRRRSPEESSERLQPEPAVPLASSSRTQPERTVGEQAEAPMGGKLYGHGIARSANGRETYAPDGIADRSSGAFDERELRRKPVPTPPETSERIDFAPKEMERNSTSTTPGIDHTPFIRFAIDQLTRDEEVRGSRQYQLSRGAAAPYPAAPHPAERVVPGERPMYMEQQRPVIGAPPPLGARHPHHTASPQITVPPPQRTILPHYSTQRTDSPVQQDQFVPFHPPKSSIPHPPLNFVPGILRPLWLGIFIFLCLLMLIGLLFCAIWSLQHNGLWNYGSFGDGRYFVFQYLPTLLGMIILIWLFQIQKAVQRVSPFMAMASEAPRSRSEAIFLDLYPTGSLLPNLQHFRAGQPILGIFFVISWLFLLTTPLLASAINVRFFSVWRWVAVQGVIWTVIVLYILLITALVLLLVTFLRAQTGLKWDPRSLADIVALLERSNTTSGYSGSQTFLNLQEFRGRLANRADRLGYWYTSKRPQDIFYGIGEEGGATRRYSVEQGRIREKAPERGHMGSERDLESGRSTDDFSVRIDIRSSGVRHRYLPWFLKNTFVIAWIVIALVLLTAFLLVSFINGALKYGFFPRLPAEANSGGFSPANFLYSFIPALLGLILYLLFRPLDLAFRRLQPYAALSSADGATADHSLLLDYPYRHPISVTINALANGHLRVAALSFLSLVYATIPVLSGGIFWSQFYPRTSQVRTAGHRPGLYALCFFLALYAFSLFIIFPARKKMALPHDSRTLAEVISWLYMSNLLVDREFSRCSTKADLVGRLVGAPVAQQKGFMASLASLTGRNRSRTALTPAAQPDHDPFSDEHQYPSTTQHQHQTLSPVIERPSHEDYPATSMHTVPYATTHSPNLPRGADTTAYHALAHGSPPSSPRPDEYHVNTALHGAGPITEPPHSPIEPCRTSDAFTGATAVSSNPRHFSDESAYSAAAADSLMRPPHFHSPYSHVTEAARRLDPHAGGASAVGRRLDPRVDGPGMGIGAGRPLIREEEYRSIFGDEDEIAQSQAQPHSHPHARSPAHPQFQFEAQPHSQVQLHPEPHSQFDFGTEPHTPPHPKRHDHHDLPEISTARQTSSPIPSKAAALLGEKDGAGAGTGTEAGPVRYGFGAFVGRDGREHLGIDRVKRVGGRKMDILD